MKMNEKVFSEKEKWLKLCLLVDAAAKVEEENHRRRVAEKQDEYNRYFNTLCEEKFQNGFLHNFPRKIRSSLVKRSYTEENLNRVSTSSSSLNLFPQNPSFEPLVSDEEKRSKKGKSKMVCEADEDEVSERRLFEKNLKKFVTSRRRYTQQNYENLNGGSTSSSDSKKTEMKDPPNPNYQSSSPSSCVTENTNRKRRAVSQKKSTGKSKKAKVVPLPPRVTERPEWILRVMKEMNSDDVIPKRIFERRLTRSDVNPGQSRLLIPLNQLIRNDFLTSAEVQVIENIGVGTILVNQWSEIWGLRFKIWQMEKESGNGTLYYVLNRGWNDVVHDNDLRAYDMISLWTFRCRGVLCFALVTVPV